MTQASKSLIIKDILIDELTRQGGCRRLLRERKSMICIAQRAKACGFAARRSMVHQVFCIFLFYLCVEPPTAGGILTRSIVHQSTCFCQRIIHSRAIDSNLSTQQSPFFPKLLTFSFFTVFWLTKTLLCAILLTIKILI